MEMMTLRKYLLLLAGAIQLVCSTAAFGQLLDDVDFRRDGNDAVVRIHFGLPIQYTRSVTAKSGDLTQIFYTVVPTANRPTEVVGERRIVGGNGLPKMVVTDEAIVSGDPFKRKVLVEFETATPFTVRAGRSPGNLEIVLTGLGAQVRAKDAAPTTTDDGKNFILVLQTSLDAGAQLRTPIPGALQGKEVFSSRRVVDGKTAYDFNLGYFVSQSEADKAQRLLASRFPQVQVVAVKKSKFGSDGRETTDALKNFQIILQSSSDPSDQLKASIPAVLQANDVFTSSRISEGKTIYDFNLGFFATQAEADVAKNVLLSRFPNAAVIPVRSLVAAKFDDEVMAVQVSPAGVVATPTSASEIESSAGRLLVEADAASARGDFSVAIVALDALLNLPPNASSRKAQEQIGVTRLKADDRVRARGEFETFLKLYPTGADSDQIRQYLQNLPLEAVATKERKVGDPVSSLNGSFSTMYFGGESKTRSQDFADSPLGGTPVLVSENDLSAQDQSQLVTNFDLNWRYRDAEKDRRFVLRESYSSNFMAGRPDRERLSALYYEQRDFSSGTSFKIGRQSPSGGGILYRFDGIQAGYRFAPKWKLNAVYGVPTDALLDARRHFYGASLDAEALTPHVSGSIFVNQQMIDDEVDRSAIGTELRYFNNGFNMSGQFDYDQLLQGLNVASVQSTLQFEDSAVINLLVDRRAVPVRSLGNVLFFQDPTQAAPARSIRELLQTTPIDMLRSRVNGVTPFQSQASLGYNRPINTNWQIGGNLNYTNVDEIQPVADILPNGQPSTGDLWGGGFNIIGSNLYSGRDTHMFSVNYMGGPTYTGVMLAYNNMTGFEDWQLEPSLRFYTQSSSDGTKTDRVTPGVRFSYRAIKRMTIDSEVSYEVADTVGPTRKESSTRMFYYVGGRFDF
jgi:tetratricopeptide (TPR) repeat protein